MTPATPLFLDLPDAEATEALGQRLAALAQPRDVFLLEGPIGAGKSCLARAFIRARLGSGEDVPSPTFTLVQVYENDEADIWHADLYRLTHPDEVWELGLDDAFQTAICLVEWPDRLGGHVPPDAMRIRLDAAGEGRRAVISGGRGALAKGLIMSGREARITGFLARIGWDSADRRHLAGDASDRRYERLRLGAATAILMDNPPGGADDPKAFAAMARHLHDLGLSAPAILAEELSQGLLLLEDLGDDLFARLLTVDPSREVELYAPAVDVLVHLQSAAQPPGLLNFAAEDWATAAGFALDWYAFAATGSAPTGADFQSRLTAALAKNADGPRVLILRDYHAENLLWLPGRTGLARVGLLDFQLGQLGQRGYDLVSLLQDARRDVRPETEAAMVARFASARGEDLQSFSAHYATLGAQRALRILGVFARLCLVAGKPGYLHLIPRVWGQLQRNLAHPALADLRRVCDEVLPAPSPEILRTIEQQCATIPSR